jgi:hypothetical protein
MDNLRSLVQTLPHSEKKLFYIMDGWWDGKHAQTFPDQEAMAGIAQEWFNVASNDPDAIFIGVVTFANGLEGGLGTIGLPRNVLDKQAQIGVEIRNHLLPAYEGNVDGADCKGITGWTWDSHQTDVSIIGTLNYKNPVYVDFFSDGCFFNRTAAQDFRQDLQSNGKGNGSHGFAVPTPDYFKNGGTHALHVRVAGTNVDLPGGTFNLACSSPSLFSPSLLATAQTGVAYSQNVWDDGNPDDYIFSIVGGQAPPGLTVDASGKLVGVPAVTGTFPFASRPATR